MSPILVFIEQKDGQPIKASLSAISAASELKSKWGKSAIVGAVFGPMSKSAAEKAAAFGLSEVYYSEAPELAHYGAAAYAQAALSAASACGADSIAAASTSVGKDFMPRVAAAWDAGQASDVIGINDDGSLKRPMYAGNAFADAELRTARRLVTFRATAFQPASSGSAGAVKEVSVSFDGLPKIEFVSEEKAKSARPELSDASIVVSGGRAMQSAENFEKYIFPLADSLNAAVGASRAAVDAGYAPNDWQVGQTGKVVAPNLYVAVGISGAIQHLAGMKDSKTIVAINKDPDAPIFEVADYGLVADLYAAVPELTEAVKSVKKS